MATREGQLIVKIDGGDASSSKETETAPNIDEEAAPRSPIIHGSPENPAESVRRRSKDLPGAPEIVRCSPNACPRSSWKPPVSKTKSRLLDPPPEEACLKSDRAVGSGRTPRRDDDASAFDDDDLEDIPDEYKKIKFDALTLVQWVSLVIVIAALVCNLWIPVIKKRTLWNLLLWKWEILVLALVCGRLVSGWGIRVIVFLVERNFLLRKRVLHFVYGIRRSVQNCLWLGLVLLVWNLIFDKKMEEKTKHRILPYVTKILVCFLVGTLIWLLKTILVKVLALYFHVNAFFDRIQEALFNLYVFETLSGPPMFERQLSLEEEKAAAAEIQEFQKAGAAMPRELRATHLRRARSGRAVGSGHQNSPRVGKSPAVSRPASGKQDEGIPVDPG
ncbi:mechanosensitive ion channel protein 8-like [Pyrus communis]|uniref:mechanosensitive ion channel protein 8-like n=1 Tax=Pyrus communis TaxID=23211 RepID=UPI0035BF0A2C